MLYGELGKACKLPVLVSMAYAKTPSLLLPSAQALFPDVQLKLDTYSTSPGVDGCWTLFEGSVPLLGVEGLVPLLGAVVVLELFGCDAAALAGFPLPHPNAQPARSKMANHDMCLLAKFVNSFKKLIRDI